MTIKGDVKPKWNLTVKWQKLYMSITLLALLIVTVFSFSASIQIHRFFVFVMGVAASSILLLDIEKIDLSSNQKFGIYFLYQSFC